MALNIPNVVLFSTARSANREALFHWVGPIIKAPTMLIARRDRQIKIKDTKDLFGYRIGVLREDIGEQHLRELGISPSEMFSTHEPLLLAKQLEKGKIDLWAYEQYSANYVFRKLHLDSSQFEAVYSLGDDTLYFAVSRERLLIWCRACSAPLMKPKYPVIFKGSSSDMSEPGKLI
ncbi:substrate-binding periplasmic protein [Dongshaea marina]|uniref:substrate-binding periplasmic protein n=1 Tax=Dongshaea marina TaxID=2047966 RepID=UPI0018FF22FB